MSSHNQISMKMEKSKHDSRGRLKSGIFKEHFKDGSLSSIGKYNNGEKTGEWKYYLHNGLLKAVGRFSQGKMIGEWTWYLYDEGKYMDDKKIGEWRTYDARGKLVKTTRHNPQ